MEETRSGRRPAVSNNNVVDSDAGLGADVEVDACSERLRQDDCFRVDAELKRSPTEVTQLVYYQGSNGSERGPYIRKYLSGGTGQGYRMLWEARRAGRRLRGVPAIYDCYDVPGQGLAVVMEYVEGPTLRACVGRVPAAARLGLVRGLYRPLCRAVSELHTVFEQPLIHRDLTPSNILYDPANPDAVTVIDLGVSRSYNPGASGDTAYLGTRAYAPPEQFGFGQTDVRTDVYTLALTLFFCLTGRDPDRADRSRGFADPAVPEPLRAAVSRAAELDPADRPPSVDVLERELTQAFAELDGGAAWGSDPRDEPSAWAGAEPGGPSGWEPVPPTEPLAPGRAAPEHPDGRTAASGAGTPARPFEMLMRLSHVAGCAWNALLVAFYLLMFVMCVNGVFHPGDTMAAYPLWFDVWTYLVFVNVLVLMTCWLLADKRRIRARHSGRVRLTQPLRLVVLVAWFLAGVFFVAIVSALGVL
jgi:hypothetical protein